MLCFISIRCCISVVCHSRVLLRWQLGVVNEACADLMSGRRFSFLNPAAFLLQLPQTQLLQQSRNPV